MEKLIFIRMYLSYVRVIMTIMCVSIVESLCDGTYFSTRVRVVRCVWLPATSHHIS
jgi:hypothetical protein